MTPSPGTRRILSEGSRVDDKSLRPPRLLVAGPGWN